MGINPVAALFPAAGAAGLANKFLMGGDGGSAEQVALETPEQRAARRALLAFSETGRFGDFQAGAEVPLGYGDYNMTGFEKEGLTGLQDLLKNSIPEQYRLSDDALRSFLDPGALDAQFQPFKDATDRLKRDSQAALKRSAGYSGNLYSTDMVRSLGDIEARGNETLSSELARLTDSALSRRLAAVPLAMQSAQAKEGAALNRVAATQDYGSLTRRLNDKQIKDRDAELLRRRNELQLPIQAAITVAGSQSQFGVPKVETSPYQELLAMAGQIGGQYLGSYAGAAGRRAGAGEDYGSYPANMGPSWNG